MLAKTSSASLLDIDDDMLLRILTLLATNPHDVVAVAHLGAVSQRLSSTTRGFMERAAQQWRLADVVPMLRVLPERLQDVLRTRCRNASWEADLFHVVQVFLQSGLHQSIERLIIQQWRAQLAYEASNANGSAADSRTWKFSWRFPRRVLAAGRTYNFSGIEGVPASASMFDNNLGRDPQNPAPNWTSVYDFFIEKLAAPLTRPDLPCIFAGPRTHPQILRVPLEIVELPVTPAGRNPHPDQVAELPPATRALVEYVRRETPRPGFEVL